jgi:inosine/guanosine/xanthosine phosphorylase family protein
MSAAMNEVIGHRAPGFRPRVAVVLGSGLGGFAEQVKPAAVIPYGDLPGFPETTVGSHAGRLVLGHVGPTPVAVLQGRAHYYERGRPDEMSGAIRAMAELGCETLLQTNAAGSLRLDMPPGALMAITDHINFSGTNILIGPNDDGLGPRFPSLRDAYDPALRSRLHAAADALDIPLADGVYLAVSGPSFETPAEIRAFRTLGADAVGMSTVHETIAARHCGLRVVAISAITNLAEGMQDEPLSHEQTLRDAARAATDLAPLIARFVERL